MRRLFTVRVENDIFDIDVKTNGKEYFAGGWRAKTFPQIIAMLQAEHGSLKVVDKK